jgi:hypothetical protein
VNLSAPRRFLLALLLLGWVPLLQAADAAPAAGPAKDPAPAPETAKPAATPATAPDASLLVLPKLEVLGASRIKEIDAEIRKLDKLIIREKNKVNPGELDRTFNSPKLTRAAALFGGNDSEHLSAVAASRVALLETERDVLEAMKRPASLEARREMEKELDQLRITRRNLDNVSLKSPH